MKKLLYICLQLPWPLDNGQKIVTVNDLTYLSEQFEVEVVSYIDPINNAHKDEYLAQLRKRLPKVHFHEPITHNILRGSLIKDKVLPLLRGLLRREPFMVSKYRNPAYQALVFALLEQGKHDILYFESLALGYIVDTLPSALRKQTKIVYRAFDIVAETLASYAKELGLSPVGLAVRLDLLICSFYERRLWRRVDALFSVTRRMNELIAEAMPKLQPKLFYFPVVTEASPRQNQPHEQESVLYIGTVHYPPNLIGLQWFIKECWPLVIAKNPKARLDIIGRGGDKLLPVPESVQVHKYIDDIEPFYDSADVFIVPLFAGSGVRLKILDALGRGIPVVSTTAGYIGLELQEGHDILVADVAELFAAHILLLLRSQQRRKRISQNGLTFIERFHSKQLTDQAIQHLQRL